MQKPLLFLTAITIFIMGYWIPEDRHMPVAGAKPYDWNPAAFWHMGSQQPQKGINIFAREGTPVVAATSGWVVYKDQDEQGENSVWVLGSKWRLHHYSNLKKVDVRPGVWVKTGEQIGSVGQAVTTSYKSPANLYYSIRSLPPQVSELKPEKPFWLEQVFYVDPHKFLTEYQASDTTQAVEKKALEH